MAFCFWDSTEKNSVLLTIVFFLRYAINQHPHSPFIPEETSTLPRSLNREPRAWQHSDIPTLVIWEITTHTHWYKGTCERSHVIAFVNLVNCYVCALSHGNIRTCANYDAVILANFNVGTLSCGVIVTLATRYVWHIDK